MPSNYQNFSRERERRGRFLEYANPLREFATRYRTNQRYHNFRYWARIYQMQRDFPFYGIGSGDPNLHRRRVRQRLEDY